jgi:RNA polymerase sigma factor (sigma-70 family)
MKKTITQELISNTNNNILYLYKNQYKVYFSKTYERVGRNTETAKEITNEAFCIALENSHAYDFRKGSVETWFNTVHKNAVFNAVNKKREFYMEDFESLALEEQAVTYNTTDIINNLPPRMRQVFTLKYLQGMNDKEISQIMDISYNYVKKVLCNGKKVLKGIYREESR